MADIDSYSYSPALRLIIRRGHTGLFSLFPCYRRRPSPSLESGRLARTLDSHKKMSGRHIILLSPAWRELLRNIAKERMVAWMVTMVARKFQRNQYKRRL